MPWGRVDDTLYDHPKLDLLPGERQWPDRLAAVGLNYIAVSWCNRYLTDGLVPADRVPKLGGSPELAELLVKAGLWEHAKSGYRIHDFLAYNDSRAMVIARREKESARKAAWRAKRHGVSPDGTDSGTPDGTDAGTDSGTHHGTDDADVPPSVRLTSRRLSRDSSRANPDPTRPDPNPTRPSGSESTPQPPASGGHGRRANGTSPRQIAAKEQELEVQVDEERKARRRQRHMAYLDGRITEAQQADMNERDATLDEIPAERGAAYAGAEAAPWMR